MLPPDAQKPVSIFVQVHYPDIWADMATCIAKRVAVPFRLVLTTSHKEASLALPKSDNLVSHRTLFVENRGRDILPFLRALEEEDDFEIGLKLHTKKSPQRADGARWRTELLNSLLPSSKGIEVIIQHMIGDPRVGFVTPAGFCLPVEPWILENGAAMQRVMATVGGSLEKRDMDGAYFAAGSMFWFRRAALASFADSNLIEMFEPEEQQLDGTIAHAMERLFPVEARRQGFLTLAMPVLLASGPQTSASEIESATQAHANEPNFLFPAPYESPASAAFSAPSRPSLLDCLIRRLGPLYLALPAPLRRFLKALFRR